MAGKVFFSKLKSRKPLIVNSILILILTACLAFTIYSKLMARDQNTARAYKQSQLVVFDLDTGQKVSPNVLMKHASSKLPPPTPAKVTQVTFILSNIGLNNSDAQKAISLPKEFVLSFSPYADNSFQLSQSAQQAGHSVLVDLPMQMKDPADNAGSLALMVENNDFRNLNNLSATLSKVDSPSGVVAANGEIFSHSANFLPILREFSQRRLYLVYGSESDDIDQKAKDNDVELLKVDVTVNPDTLDAQLASIEDLSRKNGFVVALIKSPSADVMDKLAKWQGSLNSKNIQMAASSTAPDPKPVPVTTPGVSVAPTDPAPIATPKPSN